MAPSQLPNAARGRIRSRHDYTIAWVCFRQQEWNVAVSMLDDRHPGLTGGPPRDQNLYCLGSIGIHDVVIARPNIHSEEDVVPHVAAALMTQMAFTFPALKCAVMVGIASGVPSSEVRLGDVVVGVPTRSYPGVVQSDAGKMVRKDGRSGFEQVVKLNRPPTVLLKALAKVDSGERSGFPGLSSRTIGDDWRSRLPGDRPPDLLFKSAHVHAGPPNGGCQGAEMCKHCDVRAVVKRKPREVRVHRGLIASENRKIFDPVVRDQINEGLKKEVLCIDSESAGMVDELPCLVIRGVWNYADSHSSKLWQAHAAVVAAVFAKEVLLQIA